MGRSKKEDGEKPGVPMRNKKPGDDNKGKQTQGR